MIPETAEQVPPLSRHRSRVFGRIKQQWLQMGETAGDWAIVGANPTSASPGVGSFLETGRVIVASARSRALQLGLTFGGRQALDVGCGPGRMSQALARDFDRVVGLDVSPEMIRLAREINRAGDRCVFQLTVSPDLREVVDDSFNLTVSMFVLQHFPRWLQERYLREMVRVTAPGGTLVVQVHGDISVPWLKRLPPEWVAAIYNLVKPRARSSKQGPSRGWEVHWTRPEKVKGILESAGAAVVGVDRAPVAEGRMISYWYYARRAADGSTT